jgi:hypothetical protein
MAESRGLTGGGLVQAPKPAATSWSRRLGRRTTATALCGDASSNLRRTYRNENAASGAGTSSGDPHGVYWQRRVITCRVDGRV